MWLWTSCHESWHEDKATDDHYFVLVCIVALLVKNLPTNAGDRRDMSLIPGSGRSPGGGNGSPLHYSCLGNPMDGYSSKNCKELDVTERLSTSF